MQRLDAFDKRTEFRLLLQSSTRDELNNFFNRATSLFSTKLYNTSYDAFILNMASLFYTIKDDDISKKVSSSPSNLKLLTDLICYIFETLDADAARNTFVHANPISFLSTFSNLDTIPKKRALFDAYVDCFGPNSFMLKLESSHTYPKDIQVYLANCLYDNIDTSSHSESLDLILNIYARCSQFIVTNADRLSYKLLELVFDSDRMDILSEIRRTKLLNTVDKIGFQKYGEQYSKHIETAKLLNLKMDINFWRNCELEHVLYKTDVEMPELSFMDNT